MGRTKIGIAVVSLGFVLAGFYYWRFVREIEVRTVPVSHNVEIRVFGVGTIEAQVLSRVGFQVAGKVIALETDQGQMVKAGALLARLDDAAQRAKLMKSEAALRQAEANLVKVEAQRDRASATYQQKKAVNLRRQALIARGSVSQEVADDAQVAEEIARNDLKVVEADTAIAKVLQDDAAAQRRIDAVLLDQHELRAPFDARVISRNKELGSVANAGETVFTLIAPDSIWVKAYVDESLAGALAVGQNAFVRLRSESNIAVKAEVVRIDQENDRVTEERRIYVRCSACNPLHQLRYLGEQAEVEIIKRTIPAGAFVPLKYVEAFDGRSGLVWLIDNGRLAKRRVEFSERTLDGRIQIVSRLADGVAIVADDRRDLHDGRAARPAPKSGS
jgi:HlyD family secretion protein